jgi:cold shock CspA family protein
MLGKVLWFNVKNGYGFISGLEDRVDYFAHFSKVIAEPGEFRLLNKGDLVEFQPVEADRGNGQSKPQAANIKIIEEAACDEIRRTDTDHDQRRPIQRPPEHKI